MATLTHDSIGVSGTVTASPGMAIGMLLSLTHSGGQVLVPGTLPTFTNETIN